SEPMLAVLLRGVGGLRDAPIASTAGPGPRKGKCRATPDFLSHNTDKRALHLLQRGRSEGRVDASPAARISLVIAHVRAALRPAFRSLSPCRARLPGLRTQRLAGPEAVRLYVRPYRVHDRRFHASGGLIALHAVCAGLRWAGWLSHGIGTPARVQALIVQNAVAHNEGLGAIWATRRAFWADRPAHEQALRENLLSFAATKSRHIGADPKTELYDPDLWTDEYRFLNAPGQAQIQTELFYDYRTNVAAYPKWQA